MYPPSLIILNGRDKKGLINQKYGEGRKTMSRLRLMILVTIVAAGLIACSANTSEEAGSSSALTEGYTFRSID